MNRVYHILFIFASVLIKLIFNLGSFMKICFIDSGIGGLSVFSCFFDECGRLSSFDLQKIDNIYYFADYSNSPYGAKTKEQIIQIMIANVKKMNDLFGCDFFVIACNTATACAIKILRQQYRNYTFVGIQPAIKQTLNCKGKTLVMSTSATYFYSEFVKSFKNNDNILFLPLNNLSTVIDKHYNDKDFLDCYLSKILKPFANENICNVVLGCTHYLFIKNSIEKTLGKVKFFDSTQGVVNRIINLIKNA